jgi:hypothetical protein
VTSVAPAQLRIPTQGPRRELMSPLIELLDDGAPPGKVAASVAAWFLLNVRILVSGAIARGWPLAAVLPWATPGASLLAERRER